MDGAVEYVWLENRKIWLRKFGKNCINMLKEVSVCNSGMEMFSIVPDWGGAEQLMVKKAMLWQHMTQKGQMSGQFLAEFVNIAVAKPDDHSITFVLTDLLADDKQYFFLLLTKMTCVVRYLFFIN